MSAIAAGESKQPADITVDPDMVKYLYEAPQQVACKAQKVKMELAWEQEPEGKIDLDVQAVCFNAKGRFVDAAYFNQTTAANGSVVHSGDNRTGLGEGWDESITLDLQACSDSVSIITFVVCAYNEGTSFKLVKNAKARLSLDTGEVLAEKKIDACGPFTALTMCMLFFDMANDTWTFRTINARSDGRNFRHVFPVINRAIGGSIPYLAKHMENIRHARANKLNFFKALSSQSSEVSRNFAIVLDASGSMQGQRWTDAQKAITFLAPEIVAKDADGVSLYVFSNTSREYHKVTSEQKVLEVFRKERPGGRTNLTGVLRNAFGDRHAGGDSRADNLTMLVITDGAPNNQQSVMDCIIAETKKMKRDGELSVSFIQVGNDQNATKFLTALDSNLMGKGAKFDIVDKLTATDLQKVGFNAMVEASVGD